MADDPKKELDAPEKALDSVEQECSEVLRELAGEPALDRFRSEYEKVFRALKKSHDNERRLVKKCRELNSEIVAGAAKVQAALTLSEEDQATVAALKKEIEKSWKMVDASHEKELKAKEQIAQLKLEISNMTRLLEQGAAVGLAEEADLQELIRQKEELARERDVQVEQIVSLRSEVASFNERMRAAEIEKAGLDEEVQGLREQVAQRKAEADKELKRKERLEKEIRDMRAVLEARQSDIRDKAAAVQQSEEHVAKLQGLLRESQAANERLQKEYNTLTERVARLHHTLEEHIHQNTQLLAENSQRQVEIKHKEDEIRALREEAAKASKVREQTATKLLLLERQKAEVEQKRDALKSEVAGLEREIELARRQVDSEQRKQEEMTKERERLNKARTSAENATAKHADLVKVTETMKKNLEQELQTYRMDLAKQEATIRDLEREKGRFVAEANDTNFKYTAAVEELGLRDSAVLDLQKRIAEGEAKLRQQHDLYEAVCSERNTYSRQLIDVQDEVRELRRRLKLLTHQVDTLKSEISSREGSLAKEQGDHARAQKDCEALHAEINRVVAAAREQEEAMATQRVEAQRLQGVLAEAEQERLRLRKEHDAVVGERDALGGQLVRRNEELRLLYEKIRIQQSTLQRGQAQYRERLAEIRVLRIRVTQLQQELAKLKSSVANADVLKREVHHLNRELLVERTKVKALGEELENPLNVHRWRKLEGSDPSAYEMVLKIQALQRRLISKTEEVVEKDLLISEKEKLYLELKSILARQPGPQAAEQLSLYQASLREKTKQMKALASELNMYQAQVAEYKYEIERLQREMNEVKRQYYDKKREEHLASQQQSASSSRSASAAASALPSLQATASTGGQQQAGKSPAGPGAISFRIFVSLVAGIVTGIAGITGFKGFAAYLVGHALMAGALLAKAGFRPQTYFEPWSTLAVSGVAASTELLTFILAWTLAHNTVYLF
eukprot:scaffold17.g486.t1